MKTYIRYIIVVLLISIAALNIDIDLGVVLNDYGDGMVLNNDPVYNYISYGGIKDIHTNQVICTICLLNPLNMEPDDILIRVDYKITRQGCNKKIKTFSKKLLTFVPIGYNMQLQTTNQPAKEEKT